MGDSKDGAIPAEIRDIPHAEELPADDHMAIFASVPTDYQTEITNRRPEEILNG